MSGIIWLTIRLTMLLPALPLWAGSELTAPATQILATIMTTNLPPQETHMKIKEQASGTWSPGFTPEEKATLFAIAKDTLAWCVNKKKSAFPIESYPLTPKLKTDTATFVTLKISGDLRGCIGSLEPVEPLYLSIHHNAINAALHDYRFGPVQPAELPKLEIDVSVLSPLREIPSLDDFKLGQHGIILSKGMSRAVFLPEVAPEQGWTREDTLTHLSRKAGLPYDAWRSGARFQVFESVVLSIENK